FPRELSRFEESVSVKSVGILEYEFAKRGGHMKTRLRGEGGTPRGVEARFGLTFDAIEIGAPRVIGIECGSEAGNGNGEFRGPGFRGSILDNAAMEFAMQLLNGAVRDVEINPKAIGS